MAELVVIGFKNDRYRAAAVLGDLLRAGDQDWTRELHGGIPVQRDMRGKFVVDPSFDGTKAGSTVGSALVGGLVGIAISVVALPLTAELGAAVSASTIVASGVSGLIVGARRGQGRSWWRELDIPQDFLEVLRGIVLMNDSAIFVHRRTPLHTEVARQLAQKFRPYGGTVLRATLSAEHAPSRQIHSHQVR